LNISYEELKREIDRLLNLINDGKATLEDARQRMIKPLEDEKKKINAELDEKRQRLNAELDEKRQRLNAELDERRKGLIQTLQEQGGILAKQAIMKLAEEKSQGFPWLAKAYSDFFHLQDMQLAEYLESKERPAVVAAEHLREIASKRRVAEKAYRIMRYQLEYYESLFPWLIDFRGEDIDELITQVIEGKEAGEVDFEEIGDPANKWLTKAEYNKLPSNEKYQLALDRYWQKKKTKWEIGRDYERYIGYLYESKGYEVYYQGIIEGFDDLGRDLICKRGKTAEVVQCKNWSQEKEIHEKHIFQLYGTVIAYRVDYPKEDVTGCFVTSTKLTERARQFADLLEICVKQNYPLERYPCIKCNVSRRNREKIYHLPFDQQYDRTIIEEERNECYVETIIEAERRGFRRAFRWKSESIQFTDTSQLPDI